MNFEMYESARDAQVSPKRLYYVTISFHVEADNQDEALDVGLDLGRRGEEGQGGEVKFSGDVEAEAVSDLELDWLHKHGEV